MTQFASTGTPLTNDALVGASTALEVALPEIWAVLAVETRGCGFLEDRRPAILFERHVFHERTGGRFDDEAPDLSNPDPGGYVKGGGYQYKRLAGALALDRDAALASTSWGIGQVMGYHAVWLGYPGVEGMVARMIESEDGQLEAMMRFVRHRALDGALRAKNWAAFARGYNGSGYKKNAYDEKLESAFLHFSLNGLPDLRVRAAQVLLTYAGLEPGPVDGVLGNRTRLALRQFQQRAGLLVTADVDDATLTALRS